MGKLLKWDFYKAKKMKSTWLLLAALIILSAISVMMTYSNLKDIEELKLSENIEAMQKDVVGKTYEEMDVLDWTLALSGGNFLLMFTIIFAVFLATTDFTTGFIKNMYGYIGNKSSFIISKIILTAIFSLLTFVLTYLVAFIADWVLLETSSIVAWSGFLRYTLAKWMLILGYGSLVIAIAVITRKNALTLIISLGYFLFLQEPFYKGINTLVEKVTSNPFDITQYSLVGNIEIIRHTITTKEMITCMIVSIVAIALSIGVGHWSLKNQDI
ncbi:MAG: ABC transporter permease subunit [Tissierellia bacterium]|nr:ABC transporter permease subunit [Tissierellia bacterium]